MDSHQLASSSKEKGLSAEGVLAAPSTNFSAYPASYREVPKEVKEIFFISKEYKLLAGGRRDKDLEYRKVNLEHEIPSFIELPKKRCENKKSFKVVCADCGYEDKIVSGGCDDPKCFVCHVKWSKEQAHDAGLRLMAALSGITDEDVKAILSKAAENKDDDEDDDEKIKIGLWHFTLSPPENAKDFTTPRNSAYIDNILKECYKLCKSNLIVGGCVVAHYGPEMGDEGIRKYLPKGEYRPHLHVFAFGKRPRGPWSNDRGKWICKTLNHGEEVERDFEFIRKGLHYRLSHAVRRKGKHSIRWFGAFSYNKGLGDKNKLVKLGLEEKWIERVERLGCEVVCKCPKCGGDMVRGTIFDSNGGVFVDVKGPPS